MNSSWRLTYWILTALLLSTLFEVNCQIKECGFQGIDLQQCLDQGTQASCCKSLNQAIQLGYYCICKLIGSTTPLLTNSLVLPMPNCFISIPLLNQCQEPVPVLEPPDSPPREMKPPPVIPPEWQMQPSGPKNLVMPLPPKVNDSLLDLTPDNSSSVVASQPALVPKLGDPENGVLTSSGGNKKGIWLHTGRLLLPAALHVFLASTKH